MTWNEIALKVLNAELATLPSSHLRVLEAGGGSATFLRNVDRSMSFTTVDISAEQLERNTYAAEKILGDIEEIDLGSREYDVIIMWDVLEHLRNPEKAVSNLILYLVKDGILVLKGPISSSLAGLVTRLTPHWFHVFVYRKVFGSKTAGLPGRAPFPTIHAQAAEPVFLSKLLTAAGLEISAMVKAEGPHSQKLRLTMPFVYRAYALCAGVLQAITAGRIGSKDSDFILVARRSN